MKTRWRLLSPYNLVLMLIATDPAGRNARSSKPALVSLRTPDLLHDRESSYRENTKEGNLGNVTSSSFCTALNLRVLV